MVLALGETSARVRVGSQATASTRPATAHLKSAGAFRTWLIVGLCIASYGRAFAYDVQVDSDTTFRAYEVRSNAARVFWTRRRFHQRLSLDLVQGLAEPRSDRAMPRLRVHADLRFDQELGDTCLVMEADRCLVITDGQMRATYEPLAIDGGLTIPALYVEASSLPLGTRVRAGRQTFWDPIGLARTDGVVAQAEPLTWLSLQAAAGLLVQRTSVGGRDTYARPGVPHLELPDSERDAIARVAAPATATIFGGSAQVGLERWARFGLHYRQVDEPAGLVQREAALSLASTVLSPLRVDGHGVLDTRDGRVVDAQAEAALALGDVVTRARVRRQLPRFDYGTVWAFFTTAPYDQASVGADWLAGDDLRVGLDLRGRRVTADRRDAEVDVGLSGQLIFRPGRLGLELSGFGWRGDLGPTWGGSLMSDLRLQHGIELFAELDLYRIEGISVGLDSDVTFGEAAGLSFRIGQTANASVELSHAHSGVVGHRLALMAYLYVGAFR